MRGFSPFDFWPRAKLPPQTPPKDEWDPIFGRDAAAHQNVSPVYDQRMMHSAADPLAFKGAPTQPSKAFLESDLLKELQAAGKTIDTSDK